MIARPRAPKSRFLKISVPLVLCLIAASCASPSQRASQSDTTEQVSSATVAEDTTPRAESLADPARDRNDPAVASLPPVDDDPQQFIGLSGLDVSHRLGAPALVRRDGPAEVWQYRGPNCLFDIFLYAQDDAAAPLSVRYVDLRSPASTTAERRECLARMLRAQQHRRHGS